MILYKKHNYLNKSHVFLKNIELNEYDIEDCGFSIIKQNNLLRNKVICQLQSFNKLERHIAIGKIMKENSELIVRYLDELIKIRKKFSVINDINDKDILYIKRDSICLIDRKAKKTKIMGYNFRLKNTYNTYLYLNKKEFYLNNDFQDLTVKGLNDSAIKAHKNYFLELIKEIMVLYNNSNDTNYIREYIYELRNEYLKKNLHLNMYRELNESSKFRLKTNSSFEMYIDKVGDRLLKDFELDISYNFLNYIIPLINYLF